MCSLLNLISALATVPNIFGNQGPVWWETIFPWTWKGGWFKDDSSALHILCTLFVLFFYEFHLRSPGIRFQRFGTCVLNNFLVRYLKVMLFTLSLLPKFKYFIMLYDLHIFAINSALHISKILLTYPFNLENVFLTFWIQATECLNDNVSNLCFLQISQNWFTNSSHLGLKLD